MADKLCIIALFAGLMGTLYALCMRATPHHGWMRGVETVVRGLVLCSVCHLALRPLGLNVALGPVASLLSGCLGLPGVALCTVVSLWP